MNNISKTKIKTNNSFLEEISLSGKIVNPKRDWNILIILFVILIIASIGFDAYMYQQIVSGDMYVSVKREELVIEDLKTTELQKILDNFEAQKARITTLKIQNLVDPSI
jgi:hypothetical protein